MPDFTLPMSSATAPAANQIDSRMPTQVDSRLPLSVTPFEAVDPIANETKALRLADAQETFKDDQAKRLDAAASREDKKRDKMIMEQYIKSGGDISTPEGLESAHNELKGKLSMDSTMRLADLVDTKKKQELSYRKALSETSIEELKAATEQQEETLKYMSSPLQAYDDAMAQTKDPAKAAQAYEASKMATLKMVSEQKSPDGKPLIPPEKLQAFQGIKPEDLRHQIAATQWKHKLLMEETTIKLHESQARAAESMADRRDAETEQGDRKLDILADKVKKSESGLISDEDKATMAEQVRLYGPQVLSRLGLSNAQRQSIISEVTKLNKGEGISAREGAAEVSNTISTKKSLDKMVPQLDAITAFEKTADNIGDKLVSIAKKVDQTGVPAMERWIRAGRKSIEGDPDVTELNARMQTFRTEAARIIANPNLTGVLSDSARHEMESIIPSAASAEQIERGVDVLKSEAKTRREYLAAQISDAKQRILKGAKKDETSPDGFPKVTKDRQSSMDSDRVKILKQEKASIEDRLAKVSTPEDKQRAKADLEAIDKELKNAGGAKSEASKAANKPTVSNW